MAVETTVTSANFVGTGASATYAPGFYVNSSDQVRVFVDGVLQVIGDDYSVNNVGVSTGCNIVATFPLGAAIYVERQTPITQLVDTQNNETILEDVLDAGFDKLTMIAQEVDGKVRRALLVPQGEDGYTLPAASARANLFPAFDLNGDLILSNGPGADGALRADLAAPAGSSLVGFQQSGAGAVTRTVQAKLRETVSVKDFGAVGDGVADDTAAIQAALNSSAVSVFYPAGRYRITANLTCSGHTYLYGETMTSSILQMEGTASFVYTGGTAGDEYDTKQLQIERLSFECPTVTAKSVVDASWTGGSGGTSKTFIMRDCEITGTVASGGFANGIALTNARNVVIDNVRVLGDRDAAPIASGSGILISGADDPVEIYINSYQAYFCTNGIEIAGTVEGVYVSCSTIVACNNGIVGTPTGNQPLLSVIGSHINTDVAGIKTVGFVQCIIEGNLIYGQAGVETPASYVGIDMSNATVPMETVINGNVFQNLTTGIPSNGVALQNSSGGTTESIIANNTFRLFDTGVVLGSGTSGAQVQGNRFIACTNDIIDNGSGNFIGRFGEFTSTVTSDIAQVRVENKSAANNTTKAAGYGMRGRDTVGGVKDVGSIRALPQDANWVNSTTVLYGRIADALVPLAFLGINGTPEGQIPAPVGAIATRRDGGASTTFYVKQSGTGNTGWVAK